MFVFQFFIMMFLSMFAVVVLHPQLLDHNDHLFKSANSGILATASHDNLSLEADQWLSTHAQTGGKIMNSNSTITKTTF